MEFSQLLAQISSLEASQRQDKARIAEKDAKYHQVCTELEEVQKKLQEQTEGLRVEKEKLCGLEVQNRNHEKVEKQLKESLKTMKEENANLTKRLENEQQELQKKQDEYMKDLEDICDKYRKLSNYFDQSSVSKSLSQALQKVSMLENQLIDRDHAKVSQPASNHEIDCSIDAIKSENEDLCQRVREALSENEELRQKLSESLSFISMLEQRLTEIQSAQCPNCGMKIVAMFEGQQASNEN